MFLLILSFYRQLIVVSLKFFQAEAFRNINTFCEIKNILDDKVKPRVNRRVFFCIVVIASFFSYIGLSSVFCSKHVSANRLTISQIGVFGNVIFTLASVFCIDKVIAFLSDSMSFRLCDYGSLFPKEE